MRRRKECDSRHVCGRVQYHCTRLRVVPTDMLGSVQEVESSVPRATDQRKRSRQAGERRDAEILGANGGIIYDLSSRVVAMAKFRASL
jgi:hypothetical protein